MKLMTATQLHAKLKGVREKYREYLDNMSEIARLTTVNARLEKELKPYLEDESLEPERQRRPHRYPWITDAVLAVHAGDRGELKVAEVARRVAAERGVVIDAQLGTSVSNASARLVKTGQLRKLAYGVYQFVPAPQPEPEQLKIDLEAAEPVYSGDPIEVPVTKKLATPAELAKILPPGVLQHNIGHDTRVKRVQPGN